MVEEEATRFSLKNILISHAFSLKPSIIIKNSVVFPIHKFYLCPCMNIGRSIVIRLYNRDALQFRPLFYLNHFKGSMARSRTNKSRDSGLKTTLPTHFAKSEKAKIIFSSATSFTPLLIQNTIGRNGILNSLPCMDKTWTRNTILFFDSDAHTAAHIPPLCCFCVSSSKDVKRKAKVEA